MIDAENDKQNLDCWSWVTLRPMDDPGTDDDASKEADPADGDPDSSQDRFENHESKPEVDHSRDLSELDEFRQPSAEESGVRARLERVWSTDDSRLVVIRDLLGSVAIVFAIALVLFALSGVWPPLVAVESGSMEPNMERGDMVFVVSETRFVGDDPVESTGIVPMTHGEVASYSKFNQPGDVIVFHPNGNDEVTPIIHRAHFWVEEGENWVETQADPSYVNGMSCEQVSHCPARHDGFITKGDANNAYDQAFGGARTDVVKQEWVSGKGLIRIPWLGYVRLAFDQIFVIIPPREVFAVFTLFTGFAAWEIRRSN